VLCPGHANGAYGCSMCCVCANGGEVKTGVFDARLYRGCMGVGRRSLMLEQEALKYGLQMPNDALSTMSVGMRNARRQQISFADVVVDYIPFAEIAFGV
jgi:hypothetical protein